MPVYSNRFRVEVLDGNAALSRQYADIQTSVADAEAAAEAAAASAAAAAASAAAVENALRIVFPSMADLIASVDDHSVGDVLFAAREGFSFEVISPEDTDFDAETAGGALLRALPDDLGFVHVEQFGAVPDGDRYTGSGTDNTAAFRKAMKTQHHVRMGRGTYRITQPLWNPRENRIFEGAGMGGCCSSKEVVDFFAPPSCILATGTATRRVITRRKRRLTSADPNDAPISAVLENWGGGSLFRHFSIELFCDYTDLTSTNYGADWDVGFFNACRGSTGVEHVSILGYFRRASFYWDVTDGFAIAQLYDPEGNQFPEPGETDWTFRSSGADHCWMNYCECRGGRIGLAILGADKARQLGDGGYYDWVTGNTITEDNRGVSGCSDFTSENGIYYSVQHHSGYRAQNPTGWGGTLSRAGLDGEADTAPAAVYIDVWAGNDVGASGPANAARGFRLNDMRYVSWEMFNVRLGQCKEVYFSPQRTWSERNDALYTVRDVGGTVIADLVNYTTTTYGHISTTAHTGMVQWLNAVAGIFQPWVYNWAWTFISDRWGRRRGIDEGFAEALSGASGSIAWQTKAGGFISIACGGIGSGTVLPPASMLAYFDLGSTPVLTSVYAGANIVVLASSTEPTTSNVASGQIGFSAFQGEIKYLNRLAAGDTNIAWKVL